MLIRRAYITGLLCSLFFVVSCTHLGKLENNLTVAPMDAPVEKLQSVMADGLEQAGYTLVGRYVAERRFIYGKVSVLLFHRPALKGKEEQHIAISFSGSSLSVQCFTPVYRGFSTVTDLRWDSCSVAIANAPMTYDGWNERAKKMKTVRWRPDYSPWQATDDVDDMQYPFGTYSRAVIYEDEGQPTRAAVLYERVLKDFEQRFSPSDTELLICLNHLGRNLLFSGRANEAERYYVRALQQWEVRSGKIEEGYLGTLNGMAKLLCGEKRYEEARAHLDKSIAVARQFYGPKSKPFGEYVELLKYIYRDCKLSQ